MGKTLAAWMMMASALAVPATGPREAVESAVVNVMRIVEDGAMVERRAEIRRIAGDLFDFEEITRRTLSRHWSGRSTAERAEIVSLFTDLLQRSYVTRIEAFAGEKITFIGEAVDGNFAVVKSKVVTGRAETALDYRLHVRQGRWKVYDVLVDGVSFVSTYRSQFDRIIKVESWESLVEKLRRKRFDSTVVERPDKRL
jgi:phospholipid transport system substrate-binding protein